jgi:hypothetical protein
MRSGMRAVRTFANILYQMLAMVMGLNSKTVAAFLVFGMPVNKEAITSCGHEDSTACNIRLTRSIPILLLARLRRAPALMPKAPGCVDFGNDLIATFTSVSVTGEASVARSCAESVGKYGNSCCSAYEGGVVGGGGLKYCEK